MEGEGEERGLSYDNHPQSFLQHIGIGTKQRNREQIEEGRDKETRHKHVHHNVQEKAEKMNKLELLRKMKPHNSKVIHVRFDKENNSLPHLLLM